VKTWASTRVHRARGLRALSAGAFIAAAVSVALVAGVAAPASATSRRPITVSVLGDSNTAARTTSLRLALTHGSWARTAVSRTYDTVAKGGWAQTGANSRMMLAAAKSWRPNMLVVMIGTNDLGRSGYQLSWDQTKKNIYKTVKHVHAKHVLISAIAPISTEQFGDVWPDAPQLSEEAVAYNSRLLALAHSHGWHYVDPWKSFRAADGTWADDAATADGVHGTVATWAVVGRVIGADIDRIG
jgi:lysophospholipase L1-like esterase